MYVFSNDFLRLSKFFITASLKDTYTQGQTKYLLLENSENNL
jgi:hypothetical protein